MSYIKDDPGYAVMKQNKQIDLMFPYRGDIPPRLVRYLRHAYYFKITKITPCIPLENLYSIGPGDEIFMKNYLYNLKCEKYKEHKC